MFIVLHRKIFYLISGILAGVSIFALIFWGFNPSIDFKGGSIMEIKYTEGASEAQKIQTAVEELGVDSVSVRAAGNGNASSFIIRAGEISDAKHAEVIKILSGLGSGFSEERFSSIGPVLGKEAVKKSFLSILMVLLAIVLFMTFAFRKVSEPVSSWKYGLITIIALAHDVIIPTGAFAIMGHFGGVEVDTLFVTALLVILGFSVHDTIVVFDRVRENLKNAREYREKKDFSIIVGESINQTFVRSINTSMTTVLALFVLYFIGAEATKYFSLALIIGITAGTYSSIFIGSPLLVTLERWQNKKA
ncbi:MAG: Protein translocase subunit SecF [Parcubacteria group bacterium GW2011_GWB1_44_7]|nr:MAG: Protein translocase subunit SecF [Parcubacteria group bacterium GW2011_GWB1_44_7]